MLKSIIVLSSFMINKYNLKLKVEKENNIKYKTLVGTY